jgi:hypothetical protein
MSMETSRTQVKQISPHIVGGPHAISWPSLSKKKFYQPLALDLNYNLASSGFFFSGEL